MIYLIINATAPYDSNENRTRDSTLRGSRLNRLTMEPDIFEVVCCNHLYLLYRLSSESQDFF